MAEMAVKLKDATDRNEALGKERLAGQEDLEKATAEARDARSAMRAIKEELRQAGDQSILSWANCGVQRTLIWT